MKSPTQTIMALFLGASLFAVSAPAFAQSAEDDPSPPGEMAEYGGRHHGKHERGGHHKRGGPMQIIDANGDGVIGADEAASLAERMFMRHDQNRDEILDESEFTTPHGRGGWRGWFGNSAAEADAVQKLRKEKFAALDANKDGKLSKAEVFAEMQQKLAAADADKDGKVTPWEFRALPRM